MCALNRLIVASVASLAVLGLATASSAAVTHSGSIPSPGRDLWWDSVLSSVRYEDWPPPKADDGLVKWLEPGGWSGPLALPLRRAGGQRPWQAAVQFDKGVLKIEMDVKLFSTVKEAREGLVGIYASHSAPPPVLYQDAPLGDVGFPLPQGGRLETAFCRLNVLVGVHAAFHGADGAIRSADGMPEIAERLAVLARDVDGLIERQERVRRPDEVYVPRVHGITTTPETPVAGQRSYLDVDAGSVRPGFDLEQVALYSVDSLSGPKARAVRWPSGPRRVLIAEAPGDCELRIVCTDGAAVSPPFVGTIRVAP